MKYKTVKELDDEKFRRLTGVKKATFGKIVEIYEKPIREKRLKVVGKIS